MVKAQQPHNVKKAHIIADSPAELARWMQKTCELIHSAMGSSDRRCQRVPDRYLNTIALTRLGLTSK
jgi:hypothetical protein